MPKPHRRPPDQVFTALAHAFADSLESANQVPDLDERFAFLTDLAALLQQFDNQLAPERAELATEIRRIHALSVRKFAERVGLSASRAAQMTGGSRTPPETREVG
jgi:hypothetical protein